MLSSLRNNKYKDMQLIKFIQALFTESVIYRFHCTNSLENPFCFCFKHFPQCTFYFSKVNKSINEIINFAYSIHLLRRSSYGNKIKIINFTNFGIFGNIPQVYSQFKSYFCIMNIGRGYAQYSIDLLIH